MEFIGYLIAGGVGFFLGVICSCVLLAKKNLEMAQTIENKATESVKDTIQNAKLMYNAKVAAYEQSLNESEGNYDEGVTE